MSLIRNIESQRARKERGREEREVEEALPASIMYNINLSLRVQSIKQQHVSLQGKFLKSGQGWAVGLGAVGVSNEIRRHGTWP